MNKKSESANYGIIGRVTAKAVAAGPGASAVVNENAPSTRAEFDAALAALRDQIAALGLSEDNRQALHADITKIEEMAGKEPEPKPAAAGVLKSLVDKLTMVGILLQTAVGLQAPIKALAAWFHVPLPF